MRVMMVSPYSLTRPGGVQGQVLGLARALRDLDVDVRVVGPCDGPPPAPGVVSVGPTVHWESNGSEAPIAPGRPTARRTIAAVRAIEPDVVHLHEPAVPGPCLNSLIGFAGPMVGTFHISGEVSTRWVMPAVKALMNRLDVRVAVSEAARLTAATYFGGEYRTLWNGIEAQRFAAGERAPSKRPAVLFLGRHEPRKGLAVLLEAWDGLEREAELWVAGTGPETARLRGRARDVVWLGAISDEDRGRRLRGATALCAPALGGESFGLVLLEAMAAGTPVVATDIDGYRQVARPDQEAIVVPAGDPGALRSALRVVLDDAAVRSRLADAGRVRAEEFSMAHLAERYVELYREASSAARR